MAPCFAPRIEVSLCSLISRQPRLLRNPGLNLSGYDDIDGEGCSIPSLAVGLFDGRYPGAGRARIVSTLKLNTVEMKKMEYTRRLLSINPSPLTPESETRQMCCPREG